MMHNSLLIRERLLQTNNNELHKSRRDPHRFIRKLNGEAEASDGELKLSGSWSIDFESASHGFREAADDLREFLRLSGIGTSEPAFDGLGGIGTSDSAWPPLRSRSPRTIRSSAVRRLK